MIIVLEFKHFSCYLSLSVLRGKTWRETIELRKRLRTGKIREVWMRFHMDLFTGNLLIYFEGFMYMTYKKPSCDSMLIIFLVFINCSSFSLTISGHAFIFSGKPFKGGILLSFCCVLIHIE